MLEFFLELARAILTDREVLEVIFLCLGLAGGAVVAWLALPAPVALLLRVIYKVTAPVVVRFIEQKYGVMPKDARPPNVLLQREGATEILKTAPPILRSLPIARKLAIEANDAAVQQMNSVRNALREAGGILGKIKPTGKGIPDDFLKG